MAKLGLALAASPPSTARHSDLRAPGRGAPIEAALCAAAGHVFRGSPAEAAQLVEEALSAAVPGNAAWLLPIEPLLNVAAAPEVWAAALSRLRSRAA
jgi:hypothetical protein